MRAISAGLLFSLLLVNRNADEILQSIATFLLVDRVLPALGPGRARFRCRYDRRDGPPAGRPNAHRRRRCRHSGRGARVNQRLRSEPGFRWTAAGIFTYINGSGSIANSATFPNSVGLESSHADYVAANLATIAPGIGSIDNYDANYYYSQIVATGQMPSSVNAALHDARIVNQSFMFTDTNTAALRRSTGFTTPTRKRTMCCSSAARAIA